MTVAQNRAARRRFALHYRLKKRAGRSIAESIAREHEKAARLARIKRK